MAVESDTGTDLTVTVAVGVSVEVSVAVGWSDLTQTDSASPLPVSSPSFLLSTN